MQCRVQLLLSLGCYPRSKYLQAGEFFSPALGVILTHSRDEPWNLAPLFSAPHLFGLLGALPSLCRLSEI